jgi:peptide/nickel transport system ATP-binding protein
LDNLKLEVKNLSIAFKRGNACFHAVRELSFSAGSGQMLAVVGESGCGKSLTALSLLGLTPPSAKVTAGEILFEGHDLLGLNEAQWRTFRGSRIAMIFQEPMMALNPVLTVGEQIMEAILEHERVSRGIAQSRALKLLEQVRIPDPRRRFSDYPHHLSGGMRQRVMIAMALACSPAVLVADEPTTALDVTVQRQIIRLIDDLRREQGMAVIFVSHDLALVSEYADRVLVMYAGRKMEENNSHDLFSMPLHPYTAGLIAARPRMGFALQRNMRLTEIPGAVPSLEDMPVGCAFAPRCSRAGEECFQSLPPFLQGESGGVACFRSGENYVI